jgi:two-component system, NtrC family, sensor kinase
MNVLLIEDDAGLRDAVTKVLESRGWKVTGVDRADAALTAIGQQAFDAAICDFILPKGEGTSLFEAIKDAQPALAERVLFVTGWGKDSNARKLLEHTGRPVLEKPLDLAQLIAAVQQLVEDGKK